MSWPRLVNIIAQLRAPHGCPWDRAQTHASLKRYLLEESYELFEAIEQDDSAAMMDELGDVLLQVLLHAQIAAEKRAFTIDDVINNLSAKLIRRHPHVLPKNTLRHPQRLPKSGMLSNERKNGRGPYFGSRWRAEVLSALCRQKSAKKSRPKWALIGINPPWPYWLK